MHECDHSAFPPTSIQQLRPSNHHLTISPPPFFRLPPCSDLNGMQQWCVIKSRTSADVPACDIWTVDDGASPCQENANYRELLSAPAQSPHLAIFTGGICIGGNCVPAGLLSRFSVRGEDAIMRGKTDKRLRENVIRQAKMMKRMMKRK